MDVITANNLANGRVVFQTAFGWTFHIDEAEVLLTKEGVEAALRRANADAAENRVVEPYAIEVRRDGDSFAPVRLRERIRAEGPTTGNSIAKATLVDVPPPPCGEGLGEGPARLDRRIDVPSPSQPRRLATLSPQAGEVSRALELEA